MKSDFLLAITQLSAEKNLPREVVISAVEAALVSAYRKDNFATNQEISVKINPTNGKVEVWAEKSMDVSISGVGTVFYRGAPAISQSISGMGEVKQLASKPDKSE